MSSEKSTVDISPDAALPEFIALADYWQNRALILAQECSRLRQENAEMTAALKALEPPDDGDGVDEATDNGGDA